MFQRSAARRAAPALAAFCLAVVLSGCSTPSAPQPPSSPATIPSSTPPPSPSGSPSSAAAGTTPGHAQATTPEPAPAAAPGQPFLGVDPHGGSVVCENKDGVAIVSQYKNPGYPMVQVLTLFPAKILPGWQLNGSICGGPLKWSPDFSEYLTSGTPPGSQVSHVVLIDVREGTFTDLTAPRQKNGFSDPVLNESNPVFLSDAPGDKAAFGSNMVLIHQAVANGPGTILVDRRNPTLQTPVPSHSTPVGEIPPGHPENYLNDLPADQTWDAFSPDGAYLGDSAGFRRTADLQTYVNVKCPETILGPLSGFLGWVDPTRMIIVESHRAYLVTVSGAPTCQPMIPPTDKALSNFSLSEDGTKLYFRASNTAGGMTDYSVPSNSVGAQPAPDPIPVIPPHELYRPGNY